MTCTTCHKGEVTRHTTLNVCDECYKKKFRVARRARYDSKFKSLPRRQPRGNHGGTWTVCCRTDCNIKFRAQPWQNLRWSLCPQHKRHALEVGVGLGWVERTTGLPRLRGIG